MAINKNYDYSKYPRVVMDTKENNPNSSNMIKHLTNEEWQDVLHHTHNIGDIIGGDGTTISAGEVSKEEFNTLKAQLQSANQTIINMQTTIQQLQNANTTLQGELDALKDEVESSTGTTYDDTELRSMISTVQEDTRQNAASIADMRIDIQSVVSSVSLNTERIEAVEQSSSESTTKTETIEQNLSTVTSQVSTLEETVDAMSGGILENADNITALDNRVKALENSPSAEDLVVDYDAETPGIQDIEGNTIPTTYSANSMESFNASLNRAALSGDTIKINSEIDSQSSLINITGKDIIINTNGQTIIGGNTPNNGINVTNGKLTLTGDGEIVSTETYDSSHSTPVVTVRNDGELELDGITITAANEQDPENLGHFGVGLYGDGSVVINDANITAGFYAVTGNGSATNADSVATINGGKLLSTADFAIYHPHPGTLIVNGGEISGAAGAISANNGNITINGGTLTSDGTGNTGEWADGTSGQSPAVINLNGKYGPVTCTINGGKFIALNNAPIVISGTKYPVTINITAGEFSAKPNDEWIDTNSTCSAEPNDEGFYVVTKN